MKLDTHVVDVGARREITERVACTCDLSLRRGRPGGQPRPERLDLGVLSLGTGYHLRLHRSRATSRWAPRRDLSLRAGDALRAGGDARSRRATSARSPRETLGAIADARWRPSSKVDLFVRYEYAQVDDPYRSTATSSASRRVPSRETCSRSGTAAPPGSGRAPRWMTLALPASSPTAARTTRSPRARWRSATARRVTLTPIAGLAVLDVVHAPRPRRPGRHPLRARVRRHARDAGGLARTC